MTLLTETEEEPWRYCSYCNAHFDSPEQFIAHILKRNSPSRYTWEELQE